MARSTSMAAAFAAVCVTALFASACGVEPTSPPTNSVDPAAPTYHADVAPLLARQCASCHHAGGAAPFPLDTYGHAVEHAADVVRTTAERVMPPWPADSSGACGTFVDSRWLSDAEIELLAAWADAGSPEGDPAAAVPLPAPIEPQFSPAVTLAAEAPYTVRSGPDEYRCFVVDPQLASDAYITALRVELDRADVVHHIQLFAADDDAAEQALDALAAADPAPGYACGEEGVGTELRYIGVWAAGDLVRRWADDTGILVRGGRRLVLQVHYHNHGGTSIVDHTRVSLELAPEVAAIGDIHNARNTGLFLLPGQADVEAIGLHSFDLTAPALARGARIHMHRLGTRARLELVRDGESHCLLSIPRWDFSWQLFYMFAEPIALAPGDQVRLTCAYDTRMRAEPVTWGLGTDDEMCIGYTYFTQ